ERAFVSEDDRRHLVEVLIQELDHFIGRHFFREARETSNVGEENSEFPLFTTQFQHLGLIHHLLDDVLIEIVLERRPGALLLLLLSEVFVRDHAAACDDKCESRIYETEDPVKPDKRHDVECRKKREETEHIDHTQGRIHAWEIDPENDSEKCNESEI